jgi:hypothetical protein
MKKLIVFFSLVCVAVGLLSAQSFSVSQYEEITLDDFNIWRQNNSGEGVRRFQIPVFFSSKEDVSLSFIDANLETELSFESEALWPLLRSGQMVTVYCTVQGPWIWDRQLDAIDYGNSRLVQAGNIGSLTQSTVPPVGGTAAVTSQPSAGQAPVPAINPTTDEIASSREKLAETAPSSVPAARPAQVIVRITGKSPQSGRYYRLQVGSFAVRSNATRAFNKLKEFGLSPAFEEFENKVRVVLPRVPGNQVITTAEKIGSAGFSEVWCRDEL